LSIVEFKLAIRIDDSKIADSELPASMAKGKRKAYVNASLSANALSLPDLASSRAAKHFAGR